MELCEGNQQKLFILRTILILRRMHGVCMVFFQENDLQFHDKETNSVKVKLDDNLRKAFPFADSNKEAVTVEAFTRLLRMSLYEPDAYTIRYRIKVKEPLTEADCYDMKVQALSSIVKANFGPPQCFEITKKLYQLEDEVIISKILLLHPQ